MLLTIALRQGQRLGSSSAPTCPRVLAREGVV